MERKLFLGWMFVVVIMLISTVSAKEMLVYKVDRPIVDSEKGFVWMFGSSSQSAFPGCDISGAMKSNWHSPVNYAEGTMYFYVKVKNQPTNTSFHAGFSIWQSKEGATSGRDMYYYEESATHFDLLGKGYVKKWTRPVGNFNALPADSPRPIDWSRPRYRQSIRFWTLTPTFEELCCSHYNSLKDPYFPLDIRFLAVVVAKGDTFSGWENYLPKEPRKAYTSHTVPGKIQAEHYDFGGSGDAYFDETELNKYEVFRFDDVDLRETADAGAGYKLTASGTEEWTEYTANVKAGTYDIKVRAATPRTGDNKLTVKLNGSTLGSIDIPVTGGWDEFQTLTIPGVTVPASSAGKIRLEPVGPGWHLNWVEFVVGNAASIRDIQKTDFSSSRSARMMRLDGRAGLQGGMGIYIRETENGLEKVLIYK